MNKLEKLAIRIGEISNEITELKSRRQINLDHCHATEDEDFEMSRGVMDSYSGLMENCLYTAYAIVKEDRENEIYSTFSETINMYGCANCLGAYKAKEKIGLLKQERGRIVGNISKIGKSL